MKCKRITIATCPGKVMLFVALNVITNCLSAQTLSIPIVTKNNAMVLQVENNKDVNILYFGEKLADENEYSKINHAYRQTEDYTKILNAAYTPSGSRNLVEPAITVTHADG
ncbi:MAG: alpha-galactosidase, partial [Segetibacter sp.]|nr:alpha-galactosidase [Segetibacter sp.]